MLTPAKLFDINDRYWLYIFEHMQTDGLIERFYKREHINNQAAYNLANIQITPKGTRYLLDNNFIAKAKTVPIGY